MNPISEQLVVLIDVVVVVYFGCYAVVNLMLLAISSRVTAAKLQSRELLRPHSNAAPAKNFHPLVSLIVPAYCEEVTIVANVNSLLRLEYPSLEIIVVNDGSSDRTVDVIRKAFDMVRSDVDYDPHLGTMPIRACFRATGSLPQTVKRLVLLDKDNGGKADAINAGINAAHGSYVITMDADSLLVPNAVELVMQPILDNPNDVVACGGQVALANGCRIEDGRLDQVGLPSSWIARFQVVEYIRSFTQSRTALARVNALVILSGVFAVFHRKLLVEVGGFLTTHMRSRVGREYCGANSQTVCEDMEVIVRLHRYLRDHGLPGATRFLPFPIAWTEAPEVWRHLGQQRNRWYRGLCEVLWTHRKMMLRPRYGRIGMFALPYQLLFEALAPVLETLAYLLLPISWGLGLLSVRAVLAFGAFALAFNLLLSVGSVMIAIRRLRAHGTERELVLLDYRGVKAVSILILASFLSNLGYRQYLIWWQLRGLKDFINRRSGWDKFTRRGFSQASVDPS